MTFKKNDWARLVGVTELDVKVDLFIPCQITIEASTKKIPVKIVEYLGKQPLRPAKSKDIENAYIITFKYKGETCNDIVWEHNLLPMTS